MLEGKYLLFCDSLDDVLAVRKSCGGQSCRDNFDSESIHVIVYEDNKPIACGRMLMNNNIYAFDMIYVLEQKRNNKVGDFVLRLLIEKAYLMCAKEVYIKSNSNSRDFFTKFGFENINRIDDRLLEQYDLYLDLNNYMNRPSCCNN